MSSEISAACSGNCDLLYARVDPNRIWYLKFILEGYDGLAVLSTEDRKEGVVRFSVNRSRYTELILLLEALVCKIMKKNYT